jgi:ornithine cyclodeaminase/alanine dehydrogenase-like protein (mu-crystallin family)
VRELLYLSGAEVKALLPDLEDQLTIVERTYRAIGSGEVDLPPKPAVHPRPNAFVHAMPVYLREDDVVAVKWIAGYRQNKAIGLPYLNGLVVVNDSETGVPVAVMDAAEITAARTAAASGVCIRHWAPSGWRKAAIIGFGVQGERHARVVAALNPEATIAVFDPHPERLPRLDGPVVAAADARAAVAEADVVITTAPMIDRPDPPLAEDWLADRTLLLPVDFDAYVRASAIATADLFLVDDVRQFEYYRGLGHFAGWPAAHSSVGEALEGNGSPARVACANLGVAALDAAYAKAVLDQAAGAGVGTTLSL